MKSFQIYKYALTLLFFISMSACKEQLEEVTPQTSLNQSLILTDANAALTLYNGVYSTFRTFHSTLFTFGEMRSDIWVDGLFTESEDPAPKQYYTHNLLASNAPAGNWGGFYNLVNRVNTVYFTFPKSSAYRCTTQDNFGRKCMACGLIFITPCSKHGVVCLSQPSLYRLLIN